MLSWLIIVFLAFGITSQAAAYVTDSIQDSVSGTLNHFAGNTLVSTHRSSGIINFRDVKLNTSVSHKFPVGHAFGWKLNQAGLDFIDCAVDKQGNGSLIRVFNSIGELKNSHSILHDCAYLGHNFIINPSTIVNSHILGPVFETPGSAPNASFKITGFLSVPFDDPSSPTFLPLPEPKDGYLSYSAAVPDSLFVLHEIVEPDIGSVAGILPRLYDHKSGTILSGPTIAADDCYRILENQGYWLATCRNWDFWIGDFEVTNIFGPNMEWMRQFTPIMWGDGDESVISTSWGWVYFTDDAIKTLTLDGQLIAETTGTNRRFSRSSYSTAQKDWPHGGFVVPMKDDLSDCYNRLVHLDANLGVLQERNLKCDLNQNSYKVFVTKDGHILSADINGFFILNQNFSEVWNEPRDMIANYIKTFDVIENESGDLAIRYLTAAGAPRFKDLIVRKNK